MNWNNLTPEPHSETTCPYKDFVENLVDEYYDLKKRQQNMKEYEGAQLFAWDAITNFLDECSIGDFTKHGRSES